MASSQSTTFISSNVNVFEDELNDPGVLARIVPVNDAAKTAFNGLARGQEEGLLQEYHNQFIQVEGFAKKEEVVYSSESENDVNSPTSFTAEGLPPIEAEQLEGHYVLSLLRPPLLASGVGWRIGKGSARSLDKSVDILVMSPGRSRGFDSVSHPISMVSELQTSSMDQIVVASVLSCMARERTIEPCLSARCTRPVWSTQPLAR